MCVSAYRITIIHAYTYMNTYIYTRLTHIYTYMHAYKYAHTHVCARMQPRAFR